MRVVALMAVSMVAAFSSVLPAQSPCGAYIICWSAGPGEHKVQGPSAGGVYNLHGECNVCVYGECHPGCDASLAPDIRESYRAVLVAASEQAPSVILTLSPKLLELVRYNSERNSIQVLGCDRKTIVANVPIRSQVVAAVAVGMLNRSQVSTKSVGGSQ